VVGNHPAARVIASLRRSAAIVVSYYPLAAPPLFPLCPLPVSRTVFSPFLSLSLSLSLLSLSRFSVHLSKLVRFGPLTHHRTPLSYSVSRFSYYHFDLASSAATTAAVAAQVSYRGRRGCLSYTGIRNTVIPRISSTPWPRVSASSSSVPSSPTSNAPSTIAFSPFSAGIYSRASCRRLRHC